MMLVRFDPPSDLLIKLLLLLSKGEVVSEQVLRKDLYRRFALHRRWLGDVFDVIKRKGYSFSHDEVRKAVYLFNGDDACRLPPVLHTFVFITFIEIVPQFARFSFREVQINTLTSTSLLSIFVGCV